MLLSLQKAFYAFFNALKVDGVEFVSHCLPLRQKFLIGQVTKILSDLLYYLSSLHDIQFFLPSVVVTVPPPPQWSESRIGTSPRKQALALGEP